MKTFILILIAIPLWLYIIGAIISAYGPDPAVDPDTEALKAEVMKYIIEPCYLAGIRRSGELTEFMPEKDALELIKIAQAEDTLNVTETILPVVRGKNPEQRQSIYEESKKLCISGL